MAETAGASENIVEFTNVTKIFHEGTPRASTAIRGVSFTVENRPDHGEFVGILGPSGCGKSTIIRMIAGLRPHFPPSTGSVKVGGKEVQGPGADRGMVFQDYTSFDNRPYIRGIGRNTDNLAVESGVAVYYDGVYNGANASTILQLSTLFIDQIQVLRGSQGLDRLVVPELPHQRDAKQIQQLVVARVHAERGAQAFFGLLGSIGFEVCDGPLDQRAEIAVAARQRQRIGLVAEILVRQQKVAQPRVVAQHVGEDGAVGEVGGELAVGQAVEAALVILDRNDLRVEEA